MIKKLIEKKNIDLALIINLEDDEKNLSYLTDYKGMGCLAIPKQGKPFLLVPKMEMERAKTQSSVSVVEWPPKKRLFEAVKIKMRKQVTRIGVVFPDFSLTYQKGLKKAFKGARLVDIHEDMTEARAIKTSKELTSIRKACSIASTILNSCLKRFKTFKTEQEVAQFLHIETIKSGCELAFPPIVASGSGASQPHYTPKNKLRKGFCVIDFGVNYKGYCSDMTRTIYLGNPTEAEKRLYYTVLQAQQAALETVKEGVKCRKAYDAAVKALGKESKYFIHGLGHGVGLDVHESPNLSSKSTDAFKKNMVFTIEPGVYRRGVGIRIEDQYLLKSKVEVLTTLPSGLMIK